MYFVKMTDYLSHCTPSVKAIFGGDGGIRTYSPRGNGFTVRRDSPTSPHLQNNRIVYFSTGIEPATVCVESKCSTDELRIIVFAVTILKLVPSRGNDPLSFDYQSNALPLS